MSQVTVHKTLRHGAEEPAYVLLADDPFFSGSPLSRILEAAGYKTFRPASRISLASFASALPNPPHLLIVSLASSDVDALERIRKFRSSPRVRLIPVLGVASFDHLGLDLPLLRSYGVVGLVDARAEPELVVQRVEQIVRPIGFRRVCERTPCFFPVEVERDGATAEEYALDLSASGMRLTSRDPLEPNTDLEFCFRLPMVADEVIEANARLVHQLPCRNSCGRYEEGVFFYPLRPHHRAIIEHEVARLLAG